MAKKNTIDVYFDYMQLISELEKSEHAIKTDRIESQILHAVMLESAENKGLLSSKISSRRDIGSPATIHGRISDLVKKNLLRSEVDDQDARRRKISLGSSAVSYFNKYDDCIGKASIAA